MIQHGSLLEPEALLEFMDACLPHSVDVTRAGTDYLLTAEALFGSVMFEQVLEHDEDYVPDEAHYRFNSHARWDYFDRRVLFKTLSDAIMFKLALE